MPYKCTALTNQHKIEYMCVACKVDGSPDFINCIKSVTYSKTFYLNVCRKATLYQDFPAFAWLSSNMLKNMICFMTVIIK